MSRFDFEFSIKLSLKARRPEEKADQDAMQPATEELQAKQREHEENKQVERPHDDTPPFVPRKDEHTLDQTQTARALDVARKSADKANADFDRFVAKIGTARGHREALAERRRQLVHEVHDHLDNAFAILHRMWDRCSPYAAEISKQCIPKVVVELIFWLLKQASS